MTVTALPYIGRLTIGYLLETLDDQLTDDGHSAYVVGNNIGSDISHDTYPFVHVSQIGGSVVEGGSIYWLGETLLQISVWGPGGNDRYAANTIAATAAALLANLSGSVEFTVGPSTVEAVVSRVEVGIVIDGTDEKLRPPRPFAHFDAVIAAHPRPDTGS